MSRYLVWGGTNNNPGAFPGIDTKGLQVESTPVVMVDWRESPQESAYRTLLRIRDQKTKTVFVNGLMRETSWIEDPISVEGLTYWNQWVFAFANLLERIVPDLQVLALDHARFSERRKPQWKEWMTNNIVEVIRSINPELEVGMYGLKSGPTYWQWGGPDIEEATADPNALPWMIAPSAWRPNNGNVSLQEFIHNLTLIHQRKNNTVLIWCEPDKISERTWKDMLAAIALVENREVEVKPRTPVSIPWIPISEEKDPPDFIKMPPKTADDSFYDEIARKKQQIDKTKLGDDFDRLY